MRELLLKLPAAIAYIRWPDLVVEFANERYRRMVGGREVTHLKLCDALPEPVGQLTAMVKLAGQSGQRLQGHESRVTIHRPGQEPKQEFVDFAYQPVQDKSGGLAGVLLYGSDVTAHVRERHRLLAEHRGGREADLAAREHSRMARERLAFLARVRQHTSQLVQAEKRRRQLEVELHQAEHMQTLGQLTSGIAHDFGNLLAVIVGYAEMAEDVGNELDPELHRILGEIHNAADRAVRLSGDLLRFSSRARAEAEAIDLNTLIADLRDLLTVSIGSADITFELSQQTLPAVWADRGELEQVLLNLAVNARDAMPAGGTLTISTRAVDLDEDRSHRHPGTMPGRYVELAVKDTGVGMSPDVKERIFERFFTTKPPGTGTGLGLSTVRGIVSDLGGTIAVESQEGRGTTFRIRIPAMPGPAALARHRNHAV